MVREESQGPRVPRSRGPKFQGSQGPRYIKLTFKYELDSKEGPSCFDSYQKEIQERWLLISNVALVL